MADSVTQEDDLVASHSGKVHPHLKSDEGQSDFSACYAGADLPHQCVEPKADYLECLHRTKEISRAMKIKSQYLTKTKVELEQKRKEIETTIDSGILGLGLLQRVDEAQPST